MLGKIDKQLLTLPPTIPVENDQRLNNYRTEYTILKVKKHLRKYSSNINKSNFILVEEYLSVLDHFRKKYSNKCNFTLPKQVIHGDFNSNNIFVNSKTNEITNIIDWEQASYQFKIYEVVYAANFFSLNKYSHKEPYDLKKFFNFISAYNNINPLTKKEKNYASMVLLFHWLNST